MPSFDLPEWREKPTHARPQLPRAVALKAITPDDPAEIYPDLDPFAELKSLAGTAGLDVVATLSQRRSKPHPSTYVGKGKLEELVDLAEEHEAEVILVDDPISPSQGKTIEDRSERRVVDRAELIMDIFAVRAQTHQAKLQVELAQLRYSQSRLTRMWTHLSRIEGGIGMRGPGETQLETDRRIIRRKISLLRDKLDDIEQQQATQMKGRRDAFKVALVGYTNAGKSTLFKRLTAQDTLVENRLFSTLDTNTRKWDLDIGRDVLLSDTVGFIRKLPHSLVASFHATLAEAREADLLLHVVDSTSPTATEDIEVVNQTLKQIGCYDRPTLFVFNKIDELPEGQRIELNHLVASSAGRIAISAHTGTHVDHLIEEVKRRAQAGESVEEYLVPHDRGDLVNRLHDRGSIESEEYLDGGIKIRVRLSAAERSRFERLLS